MNEKLHELTFLIEALTKQIPQYPIDFHHCPRCEAGLATEDTLEEGAQKDDLYPNYCPDCGQRIRW